MPLPTKWRKAASAKLVSAALAVLTFACDPPGEVGLDVLPDEVPVGAIYQELTVNASTVLRDDSVSSANKNNFLAGRLRDVSVGTTTAEAFLQLSPLTSNLSTRPGVGRRADSLVLYVAYGQFYGSADDRQVLEVRELDQAFADDVAYYASSSLTTKMDVLGTATFKNRYTTTASTARVPKYPWIVGDTNTVKAEAVRALAPMRFNLTAGGSLKDSLLSKLGTPVMASPAALQAVVKGIAIRPTTTAGAIVNFNPLALATRMVLYYHLAGDTVGSASRTFSFSLGNPETERYFTRISTNFADGKYLPAFATPTSPDTVAASADTDFATVMQGGLELGTRLWINGLKELKQKQAQIAINRAELVIPVKAYAAGVYPVLAQGYLYELNKQGRVLSTNASPRVVQASGYSPNGTNTPAIVAYDATERAYKVNLTTYLDSYLTGKLIDQQTAALMLVPTLTATQSLGLNRALLDAAPGSIKLKVYYSELNQ